MIVNVSVGDTSIRVAATLGSRFITIQASDVAVHSLQGSEVGEGFGERTGIRGRMVVIVLKPNAHIVALMYTDAYTHTHAYAHTHAYRYAHTHSRLHSSS